MNGSDATIPDAELPDLYRREAARCRQQADVAETVEMRVILLETAERFEQLAAIQGAARN
jgi:hypothetical protein